MSAGTDSGGGETALHETHMGRRRYLQLVGAAAVATGAGAASDDVGLVEEAAAQAAGVSDIYDPTNVTPATWAAGSIGDGLGSIFNQPDQNETALHQACMTAKEWWDSYYVTADNYIEDTPTLASIEARNAIAESWETGESASAAAGAAIEAIYGYYDTRLENHIETGRAVLTQIGLQSYTARNTDDFADFFVGVAAAGDEYTGSGSYQQPSYLTAEEGEGLAESTITLTNGEEYTTTMPEFVVNWDNGDELRTPIDDEWIDNYDAEAGTTTLATADGNEFTGHLGINVANVPEADLLSRDVFEPVTDFVDLVHRIRDQASTVAGNYELSFVEDLYTALNEGTITPQDIRGVEGTARFLSGTDDVHSSRFQMALASQLGLEQPNLSNTASMSIEYTGATGYSVSNPEDGPRGRHPAEFVEEETYTGMLFAGDTPSMITGGRYAVGPTIYSASSNGVHAIDTESGEQQWTYTGHGSGVHSVAVSPDGSTIYSGSADNEIHAIDTESGEQQWTYTGHGDLVNSVAVSPDGSTIYSGSADNEIHAIDTESGEQQWTYSEHGNNVHSVAVSPDGSTIYSGSEDEVVHAIDSESAEQQWTYTGHGDLVNSVAVSPDGSTLYSGTYANQFHAIDTESGEQQWTYTGHGSGVHSVAVSPDGSTLYSGTYANQFHAIDTESGEQQWTYGEHGGSVSSIAVSPGAPANVDGTVTDAYFFDGDSGDELQLSNGVMEVTSMEGSDGDDVQIADGDTITYIEDADGRDIEEILAEIPEIEDADDVTSLSDLELIVAEADGVESVDELPIDAQEREEPEYDSYNADEYVEYVEQVTDDYQDALEDDGGGGGGGGVSWDGFDWSWLPGMGSNGWLTGSTFGIPNILIALTGGTILLVKVR